jgi:hypothetical protein
MGPILGRAAYTTSFGGFQDLHMTSLPETILEQDNCDSLIGS